MNPVVLHEERVVFGVDSVDVVGVLRVPAGSGATAALVFAGPLTSVKEQATGNYAVAMAARGFVTLTFDHRHFGESEGSPRQYAHPGRKVEDFRGAISFLESRPEVDGGRIGAVGICAGAGHLAPAVAGDGRVKAWGAVAGFFHDATRQREWMGDDYEQALERAVAARELFEDTGEAAVIPALGEHESAVPLGDAFEYYRAGRGLVPNYINELALMSGEHTLTWDAQAAAYDITVPTIVVHSENAIAPDLARKFFAALGGLKDQVWIESKGHVDFYDEPERVNLAADHLTRHFRAHL
ncbi:MAG: alpha/beta hydrolase [Deltaproteobacteria bacterium]|jgi:fermentation-respiration switch protein FrsA (DUF1100 family)|nr:alpha/beta hydrolase [Deltaproteobacteria bacterium]